MTKTIGGAAWALALVLILAAMIVAVRPRAVAHCHDGTCHAHVGGE